MRKLSLPKIKRTKRNYITTLLIHAHSFLFPFVTPHCPLLFVYLYPCHYIFFFREPPNCHHFITSGFIILDLCEDNTTTTTWGPNCYWE